MDINFKISRTEIYVLIHFELTAIIAPTILKTLQPPDSIALDFAHLGVVLSGRGPMWLYGFLVHYYHPTAWVAIYDPRLRGAVIIESHQPTQTIGTILPILPSPKKTKEAN